MVSLCYQACAVFLKLGLGDPLAEYVSLRMIERDACHPSTLDRADRWIDRCGELHEECKRVTSREHPLPTRVLDVGASAQEGDGVRLVESSSMNGKYITLSYCWGPSKPLSTTRATLASHLAGINFEELSKTYQDAVTLSRRYGIRYLWIDALCIVQDNRQDWEREAPRMGMYYGNSYLTIAASNAGDSTLGCFQPRQTRKYLEIDCTAPSGPRSMLYLGLHPMPSFPGCGSAVMKDSLSVCHEMIQ